MGRETRTDRARLVKKLTRAIQVGDLCSKHNRGLLTRLHRILTVYLNHRGELAEEFEPEVVYEHYPLPVVHRAEVRVEKPKGLVRPLQNPEIIILE